MPSAKTIGLFLGPLAAVCVGGGLALAGLGAPAAWTAAITALCAAWWMLEPIPIPATSLIPFAAFPLTGVLTHREVATAYGDTLILLFLGGFMLSAALEKSGGHRRLALIMVRMVGGRGGRRLVLGFMLASAVLSMWITNTATVLMLLPMVLAIVDESDDDALAVPLLLGVAYAASIGGIGTPIGSPPNGIFMRVYEEATGVALGFADWMKIGLPVVLVFGPIAWLWLTRRLRTCSPIVLPRLGPWRAAEWRVMVVFTITALLWMTRKDPAGGWTVLLGLEADAVYDSTVALLAAVILFLVPDGAGGRLLDWPTARRIPWGILILFGGGIAIADAFTASGLSVALAGLLQDLTHWHVLGMMMAICLGVTFLTEVTSNTATATVLMPLLASAAVAMQVEPALLMAPAALSASFAFMLPVATPPNAIVFGSKRLSVRTMAREGIVLNFIGVAVIATVCYLRFGR
ncbi:MAG: SLC13 family permease [Phycisphaerae bacterium]|nr:SLC13 family permease [Phycisphaerae bacterium]